MTIDSYKFTVIYGVSLFILSQNHILYYVAGPVMSKFTTAFRELGTYKELLRSQVLLSYTVEIGPIISPA